MQARSVQVPATLVETRKRMQAMLALICHSDGGLGLFNGATARAATEIAPLLAGLDAKNVMSYAQRSGYQRLACGKLCLLVDAGQARRGGHRDEPRGPLVAGNELCPRPDTRKLRPQSGAW